MTPPLPTGPASDDARRRGDGLAGFEAAVNLVGDLLGAAVDVAAAVGEGAVEVVGAVVGGVFSG